MPSRPGWGPRTRSARAMGIFDPSRAQTRAGHRPSQSRPSRRRRFPLLRLLVAVVALPAIALFLVIAGAFAHYTAAIPDPLALRQKDKAPVVRILARDGSVLGDRGGAGPSRPFDS